MKVKILTTILVVIALVIMFFTMSRINPNLFREFKLLGFLLNTSIFAILVILLAIKEKRMVKFPFLTAILSALIAGFIDGVLLFSNRIYIGATAAVFIIFILYLQIRYRKFSNRLKDNQN